MKSLDNHNHNHWITSSRYYSLVQSTGGIDCMRAAIEFRPLSLFITVIQKVNKRETIMAVVTLGI